MNKFTPHSGFNRPVASKTNVEVKFWDGVYRIGLAKMWNWAVITEYRIIKPEPEPNWQEVSSELADAINNQRLLTSKVMEIIMYLGRDGLLLADEFHRADDKLRKAIESYEKAKG